MQDDKKLFFKFRCFQNNILTQYQRYRNNCILYQKKWRTNNKDIARKYVTEWQKKNKKRHQLYLLNYQKTLYKKQKLLVIDYYSRGTFSCNFCGLKGHEFLSVDHIDNNGAEHRKKIKNLKRAFYKWLIKNHFPKGFQILCHNCNIVKYRYGEEKLKLLINLNQNYGKTY